MSEKPAVLNEKDIPFGDLFPDDELSQVMIPAFVLRADLRIELDRISDRSDERHYRRKGPKLLSDSFYSRFYYFRGTLRSMHSAQATLLALSRNKAFKALLEKHGASAGFNEQRRIAARAWCDVAPMRNYFGAHAEDIGLGRCVMEPTRSVNVERSNVGLSDGIAAAILIESMFIRLKKEGKNKTITRVQPSDDKATRSLLEMLSKATNAVYLAVDAATFIYLQERAPSLTVTGRGATASRGAGG